MSSPFNKVFQEYSPLNHSGYVGGCDIAGAKYVPTGSMYDNMFAKIGQAVSDKDKNEKIIKKKKENEGVYTTWLAGEVNPTKEEKEAKQIELGLKKIN